MKNAAVPYSVWVLAVLGVLLDASIDRETLIRIRSIIESEPTVSRVKEITGRNLGRYIFVEAIIRSEYQT